MLDTRLVDRVGGRADYLGSLADRTTRLTLPLYPQPRPENRRRGLGYPARREQPTLGREAHRLLSRPSTAAKSVLRSRLGAAGSGASRR